MIQLRINIKTQTMHVLDDDKPIKTYTISTGKNGPGEEWGSEKTPRGKHYVRAKIGANSPPNTVFISRRPTGEFYSPDMREKFPNRDWILTRIFWLCGKEKGKNRLGKVDTMRRYIYIHGTPDDTTMGVPGSRGCVRMRNQDIIELFELLPVGALVDIIE